MGSPAGIWSFGLIAMELFTGDDWVCTRTIQSKCCLLKIITDFAGPVDSSRWPEASSSKRYQAFMEKDMARPAEERFPLATHQFPT